MLKYQLETKNTLGYFMVIKTKYQVGKTWEICPMAIILSESLQWRHYMYMPKFSAVLSIVKPSFV
jgi:hypothetical protein